jgi:hypothetical protein
MCLRFSNTFMHAGNIITEVHTNSKKHMHYYVPQNTKLPPNWLSYPVRLVANEKKAKDKPIVVARWPQAQATNLAD